jgi:uncharacterized protein
MPSARLHVDPRLWFLLRPARRSAAFDVEVTTTDTVGHVVQMVGVPLTEVGELRLDGEPVPSSAALTWHEGGSPAAGSPPTIDVAPMPRPQATRTSPPRFLLDVHLGSLTRRLRLLGLDAAYEIDADDDHLVERAAYEDRVLLTRDRGLLSRTALREGALVRGFATEEQLEDVLTRFAPPLSPWTRCVRCNGVLHAVPPGEVAEELEPGTRRTYKVFVRCSDCRRVYWRGAHAGPLESVVRWAEGLVAEAGAPAKTAAVSPVKDSGRPPVRPAERARRP